MAVSVAFFISTPYISTLRIWDPYLYVTPLEDRIKTFCLFLLIVLLALSSFSPVVFDSDL